MTLRPGFEAWVQQDVNDRLRMVIAALTLLLTGTAPWPETAFIVPIVLVSHGSDGGHLAYITGVFTPLQALPARTRVTLVCVGVAGVLFAWWLSTLPLLIALDWDNAFHLWQIERMLTRGDNHCGLGGTLWTCGYTAHMALEPLYGVFASVARSWGGDTLDGLRAANALAVATAAVCLAVVIHRTRATIWATIPAASSSSPTDLQLHAARRDDGARFGPGWRARLR